MSLSPIAQYHIRKLLRQNLEYLDRSFVSTSNCFNLSDDKLDRIVQKLPLASPENRSLKIQELELLTKLYRQLEQNPANATALIEIKRRIFQTLGFEIRSTAPNQYPPILRESAINKFFFFFQDQLREGMRYADALYGAAYQFDLRCRLQAYQMAWVLAEAKIPLVVTLSPTRFVIWLNLQSPSYSVLARQDVSLLKTLSLVSLALRKGKPKQLELNLPKQKLSLHSRN
ncbi:hypothetical protein H6F89_16180 [Cyanobacteria bacterium FACHB-63]|nr:hypothetical protein [Cyanobacteria bacterium FACHB-63]